MQIELFKYRHIFAGDNHIGKYHSQSHTVYLRDEFADKADDVKAYFLRTHGVMLAAVVVGNEEVAQAEEVKAFPPEVDALKSIELGERTPAVIEWARRNLTKREFDLRYRGDIEYRHEPVDEAAPVSSDHTDDDTGHAADIDEPVAEAAPKKPRGKKS